MIWPDPRKRVGEYVEAWLNCGPWRPFRPMLIYTSIHEQKQDFQTLLKLILNLYRKYLSGFYKIVISLCIFFICNSVSLSFSLYVDVSAKRLLGKKVKFKEISMWSASSFLWFLRYCIANLIPKRPVLGYRARQRLGVPARLT